MSGVYCQAVTQEVSHMQLHAAFPELDIDLVNDFLAECHGDVRQAMTNIEALLGPSNLKGRGSPCLDRRLPVQPANKSTAPSSCPAGVTGLAVDALELPLPTPAATLPAALLPRESSSPPSMAMPHLFPKPTAAKPPVQAASRPAKKGAHKGIRPEERGPGAVVKDASPGHVELLPAGEPQPQLGVPVLEPDEQQPLESQPAAAPATPPKQAPVDWEGLLPRPARPSRLVGLPVPLPAESPSGGNFDGNPKNPKHARSGVPSGILELLNLPDEAKAAFQQGPSGAKAAVAERAEEPEPAREQTDVSQAAPSVPTDAAVEGNSWEAGSPEEAPSEHAAKLEFLQGLFVSMDAGLVADVFHGCAYNADAAMDKLMSVQSVMDRSGLTGSSSEGGSFSSGADASGGGQWDEAPFPVHDNVEGQPWDLSGTPTDYSLKDCTVEQKLVLIRRELPGCSAEEAASCLELCHGDMDAALANLSQVHDSKDMLAAQQKKDRAIKEHGLVELQVQFPDADAATLIAVYAAAGESLDDARQMLIDSGLKPKAPDAPLSAPVSLFKPPSEASVRMATQALPQGLRRGPVSRSAVEKQRIYEENMGPVNFHWAEMERNFALASQAFDKNEHHSVQYYKEEGFKHRAEMRKAKKLASHRIHNKTNESIENEVVVDLHGLHVEEAVKRTSLWITTLAPLPTFKTLKIITGKGNHSRDGPRLLPAVIKYLQVRGHQCEVDPGGGHVYVYLPPPGDENLGLEEPRVEGLGPFDRGRQGSSREESPPRRGSLERQSAGYNGGCPNGIVLGDFLPGY